MSHGHLKERNRPYESVTVISSVPEKSVRCTKVTAIKDVRYIRAYNILKRRRRRALGTRLASPKLHAVLMEMYQLR